MNANPFLSCAVLSIKHPLPNLLLSSSAAVKTIYGVRGVSLRGFRYHDLTLKHVSMQSSLTCFEEFLDWHHKFFILNSDALGKHGTIEDIAIERTTNLAKILSFSKMISD